MDVSFIYSRCVCLYLILYCVTLLGANEEDSPPIKKILLVLNYFAKTPATFNIKNAKVGHFCKKVHVEDMVLHVGGPVEKIGDSVNKMQEALFGYSVIDHNHIKFNFHYKDLKLKISQFKTKTFNTVWEMPIRNMIRVDVTLHESPSYREGRSYCDMKLREVTVRTYASEALYQMGKEKNVDLGETMAARLAAQLNSRMGAQLHSVVSQAIADYQKVELPGCDYKM